MPSLKEAIEKRRSMPFVTEAPVAEALITQILQAAVWAPTHKKTEPWRFHVFTGEGRSTLAEAAQADAGDQVAQKVYRAPVIVAVVAATGHTQTPLPIWEEEAATAAALQNMGLMAYSLGLGGIWRTGKFTTFPSVRALLKVQGEDRIMGFFYLGHPDENKPVPTRPTPTWADKTIFYK